LASRLAGLTLRCDATRLPVLLAALVALALIAAPPAHARHHGQPTLGRYVLNDGTGQLIANPADHPEG